MAAIDLDAGTVVASFRPLTVTSGSARAVAFVGNAVALGGDFVGTVAVAGGGAGAARQQTALVFAE